MILMRRIIPLSFILAILVAGCKKEDIKTEPVQEGEIPSAVIKINEFIHDNMDYYYLWNKQMPELDYTKQPNSFKYFDTLLYKPTDRWSFITDDYEALINSYQGIEVSMGHSFSLFWKDETHTEIIGILEFVYPNSPASEAGLKRGDIFSAVDGMELNADNYVSLLNETSYTLTIAEFTGDVLTPVKEVDLTARQITENPILRYDTLKINGATIGYMAYKNFLANYNDSLTSAFTWLKNAGVTEMVLDLRYNNGGYITAMQHLSSILAPIQQVENKSVIIEDKYNENLTQYYTKKGSSMKTLFKNAGTNLDLNTLYILTGQNTASASEALIIGLAPYMNVVTIGGQTHGKYTGALVISDPEKKHNWAIQPIVSKYANSVGYTDFPDGLTPTIAGEDDLSHGLGSPKEGLMALALEQITGTAAVAVTKSLRLRMGSRLKSYDSNRPRKNIPLLKETL